MPKSNLIAVIEGFTDWSAPWRFLEAVLTHGSLTEADRVLIRSVWADACNAAHWKEGDLSVGSDAADRALHGSFPWLSSLARSHFVQAASYEWK